MSVQDEATIGFAEHHARSRPIRIRLFDPNSLLAVVVVLFWPLKFFPVILVPAVFVAGLTAFKHWSDITSDLRLLLGEFSFLGHLLLGLLIINLSARLSMGAVIRASGGVVREFGLGFFLGFVPRFYVDRSSIPRLDRHAQLWTYGAPLLVRLSYFTFGVLAWAIYRSGGARLADFALIVSQVGLWAFMFAMMPLMPGDGYNLLATYFRRPMLRQKALAVLNAKLRGRPLPHRVQPGEVPMLILFAVSSILVLVAVAFALLIIWGSLLARNLQGLGALLFVVVAASFALWLLRFQARVAGRGRQARDLRLLHAAIIRHAPVAVTRSTRSPTRWTRRLAICLGVFLVLAGVMFLPSSYDPAGPFKILPVERSAAVAETDGAVLDVMVREGDWVSARQVLGHLSSTDQQREIALTRENLKDAEEHLALLEGGRSSSDRSNAPPARGPVDAERELASNEVERLRQQFDSDETQLERTTIRAPAAGRVTTPNPQLLRGFWLNAGDQFLQIDNTNVVKAEIEIAQGDIALVKTGVQVRLRPWAEANREIVGRVTAIAAAAVNRADNGVMRGTRSLPNDAALWHPLTGQQSTTFAAKKADIGGVERQRASITDMETGGPIRRTAHRLPAPLADNIGTRGVILVEASVPNSEPELRGAMTGYAKITGPEMTVGEAYFRLAMRFVTVELWSWVP
jgi:multidrug efflux pump subunit AcrA (membrane-fusion protein)